MRERSRGEEKQVKSTIKESPPKYSLPQQQETGHHWASAENLDQWTGHPREHDTSIARMNADVHIFFFKHATSFYQTTKLTSGPYSCSNCATCSGTFEHRRTRKTYVQRRQTTSGRIPELLEPAFSVSLQPE